MKLIENRSTSKANHASRAAEPRFLKVTEMSTDLVDSEFPLFLHSPFRFILLML